MSRDRAATERPRMVSSSDRREACEERQPQCGRRVKHHDGGQHKQRACHFPQRLPALIYFSVASMALWMCLLHLSTSFLAIICCASPNSLVAVAFASPSPMA